MSILTVHCPCQMVLDSLFLFTFCMNQPLSSKVEEDAFLPILHPPAAVISVYLIPAAATLFHLSPCLWREGVGSMVPTARVTCCTEEL